MSTFDIFDEQTDFSFLNIAEPKSSEVSKKRTYRAPLTINDNSVVVKAITPDIGKWNRGRKHTQEHRAKLTAVNTGRKLTGVALDNVRAGNAKRIGVSVSESTKAKISQANKGGTGGPGNSKEVMTPKGRFASAKLAAEFYGCSAKVMRSTLTRTDERGQGFYFVSNGEKKLVVKPKGRIGNKPKKIMTPAGMFESAKQAAEFFGFAPLEVTRWTRNYPQQFYYIKD
jgi:hypothetical protein